MKDIKFTYGPQGELNSDFGSTSLSHVFLLGALSHTKKARYDGEDASLEYATDPEGLEDAIQCANEIMDYLHVSMGMLGKMLAYIDTNEVESDLGSLGWLIKGLSELAILTKNEYSDMKFALDKTREES